MTILFISPTNFGLQKPIEEELRRQGHCVRFIADDFLPHDNGYRGKSILKKVIDYILFNNKKILKQHWDEIDTQNNIFSEKYDICLCINGLSFGDYVYNKLIGRNPNIRFILYLWDTLNFFEYSRNFRFFDKIYSFDYNDSINNNLISFLPFYWVPTTETYHTEYSVSLIGSHHDDRLQIAEYVAEQLEKHRLSYFFRIVCGRNSSWRPTLIKQYIKAFIKGDKKTIRNLRIITGRETHPFITEKSFSMEETHEVIAKSQCVLDTDMSIQAGPTPRLIWALSQNKKVITTNSYISKMPFYDSNFIQVIDRKNPIIDIDFINRNAEYKFMEYLKKLRIDNWIEELIS